MKTKNSKELFKKSKEHIAGGVNSPVRAFKSVGGTPIFFKKSRGCYLYDEDGNKYLDFVGSWGPMVLGHSNKAIVNAIKKQASKAISFGAPTKNELEIAKIIKSYIPSIEKLRMVNSGTEATMSCIRLARGTTGRKKIIKFIGCYHGHVDSLLVKAGSGAATLGVPDSPGIPDELSKLTITLEYNNASELKKAFTKFGEDIAAVIVEPIAGVIGALAVTFFTPILPYALAFAAGAMIFVVVEEVIPETQLDRYTDIATLGFIGGFIIMMTLDVALG